MNLGIDDKMPYSALVKVAPWAEKFMQNQETVAGRLEAAKDRNASMQLARQAQLDKYDDASLQKLRKEMEASNQSSRSAIGRNAQIVDSADRIKTLLAPIMKDRYKASNLDINELSRVVDGMLSNGASTIGGMTKLTPSTAGGDIAKIKQYLSGNITGTNQGEFVKRFIQIADMEQKAAQSKINAYHEKVLAGYPGLATRRSDDVANLVSKFNNDAKESVAPASPAGTITVRRKTDGAIKTLPASNAQKYLSDPNFEQVK
jgi:hypothetical protein